VTFRAARRGPPAVSTLLGLLLALLTPAAPYAQESLAPLRPATAEAVRPETSWRPTTAQPAPDEADTAGAPPGGAFLGFVRDVGHDYAAWFTRDSVRTLTYGTAAALALRPADPGLADAHSDGVARGLAAGDEYGNLALQVPLGAVWWIVGRASGGGRGGAAGRDLIRAQISASTWTYALKYAVRRQRPNGDPRSFPSGHSSASFATATVLQAHYGWRVSLPFYALGVYTAASRIHDRKHWLSDTVMGATVGVAAGRAVTLRVRQRAVRLEPVVAHGGVMLQVVLKPRATDP